MVCSSVVRSSVECVLLTIIIIIIMIVCVLGSAMRPLPESRLSSFLCGARYGFTWCSLDVPVVLSSLRFLSQPWHCLHTLGVTRVALLDLCVSVILTRQCILGLRVSH